MNNNFQGMMTNYKLTVGLEIHAELRTNTKMFCGSKNDPDEKHPNINICPVCVGHPGTLPVINEEAVKHVQRVGIALDGAIQKFSQFDRKNYFYPDIPKGYQISQYKYPLVLGGLLNGVRITRVHLEEDTARLIHEAFSLVDFNRAGMPLMELVTEPDITSAKQAREFAEELQLILQYLNVSEANMEKGEMRCEANVSVAPSSSTQGVGGLQTPGAFSLGVKVEVKNLNSFRAVEHAIEYEMKRQIKLLESGSKVAQETRGWDENKGITYSQRSKESAHDYRYFPEPDLPPMEFSDEYIEKLRAEIPELPWQKRKRLADEYKLNSIAVEILIKDRELSAFWEKVISELKEWAKPFMAINMEKNSAPDAWDKTIRIASNYFTSDFLGLIKDKKMIVSELLITPENFAELVLMIRNNKITSRVAKDVLRHMVEHGGDPSTIVEEKGLEQMGDNSQIEKVAKKIIAQNPKPVSDFKSGKENALQFLIGQVIKETSGAANPDKIKEVLTEIIGGV